MAWAKPVGPLVAPAEGDRYHNLARLECRGHFQRLQRLFEASKRAQGLPRSGSSPRTALWPSQPGSEGSRAAWWGQVELEVAFGREQLAHDPVLSDAGHRTAVSQVRSPARRAATAFGMTRRRAP